ncbi:S-layer homology domain-containing protein [Acidaminobacter sp. JC074]|uniref:S-layer homology domain-containing protein n=1 Tax=Acidaminobacter sp. JC074 TaxID=2530199 RepID=UPI001F0E9AB5|nr:S-layer homology domain-containing protein [Acidaminobacter sp. JC074]MCH4887403.1 S-layer homology domain-containing protein [Acidaminobacter sp. JC074]
MRKKIILVLLVLFLFSTASFAGYKSGFILPEGGVKLEIDEKDDKKKYLDFDFEIAYDDFIISWKNEGKYNLTLMDFTTSEKVFEVKKIKDGSYNVSKTDLRPGHEYHFTLREHDGPGHQICMFTVKEEVPMDEFGPAITYPLAGVEIEYDDLTVEWENDKKADHYKLSLIDITSGVVVIDEMHLGDDHFTIEKKLLKPVSQYQVIVESVKNNEVFKSSQVFKTMLSDELNEYPIIDDNKDIYDFNSEINIGWTGTPNAEYYLVSLRNKNSDEYIFQDIETNETEYTFEKKYNSDEKIEANQMYIFKVIAVSGDTKKSDSIELLIRTSGIETVEDEQLELRWGGGNPALITLQNLTTGEYVVKEGQCNGLVYIDDKDLIPGHLYYLLKLYLSGEKVYGSESLFRVELPKLEKPIITGVTAGTMIPLSDLELEWEKSVRPDLYEIVLKDVTDKTVVLYENSRDDELVIDCDILSSGHDYEVTVTARRGSDYKSDSVAFSMETIDSEAIELSTPKETYNIGDVCFTWNNSHGSNYYQVSLQDTTTKKLVLDNKLIRDSKYAIDESILELGHDYRLLVTAKSKGKSSKLVHDFKVVDRSEMNTALLSDWAVSYAEDVLDNDLLDETLMAELLNTPKASLTRLEFCYMMVALYDVHSLNKDIPTKSHSFNDITDLSDIEQNIIIKANALGIMSGKSENQFFPNDLISREEMAVMINNLLEVISYQTSEVNEIVFDDTSDISNWAKEATGNVSRLGIISGDGLKFNPKAKATHEMGLVILSKLYSKIVLD